MKQKDIVLIAVVVFLSGIFSFILSGLFINSPENQTAQVEVVEVITPEFPELDAQFFNEDSLNPTQQNTIGDQGPNNSPFQGEQNQ